MPLLPRTAAPLVVLGWLAQVCLSACGLDRWGGHAAGGGAVRPVLLPGGAAVGALAAPALWRVARPDREW